MGGSENVMCREWASNCLVNCLFPPVSCPPVINNDRSLMSHAGAIFLHLPNSGPKAVCTCNFCVYVSYIISNNPIIKSPINNEQLKVPKIRSQLLVRSCSCFYKINGLL